MIGVLGLGSLATLHLIETLNQEYNKVKGGYATCPLKLLNADFNEINPHLPNDFKALLPVVKIYIEALNKLNVSNILIPNITLFETIDQINFNTELQNKIIHPLKLMQEKLSNSTKKDVLVLGSQYTMQSTYFLSFIPNKIIQLDKKESVMVENMRKSVFRNGVKKEDIAYLESISNKYSDKIIVIACSELSIVHSKLSQSKNKKIDLLQLQIEVLNLKSHFSYS